MPNNTKFIKENFNYHGGYLTYNGQFVARFKYMASNKPGFLSFLIKNFTPAEYFKALMNNTPHKILESKGYVAAHIKKALKSAGYEVSVTGYRKYISDQVAKH